MNTPTPHGCLLIGQNKTFSFLSLSYRYHILPKLQQAEQCTGKLENASIMKHLKTVK